MNYKFILFAIAIIASLSACSPKVSTSLNKTYQPLDYTKDVIVIELNEQVPENAEALGIVKIGDTGFTTKCDYDIVLDKAKLEARKAGGNAIKITEHKYPSAMTSTCHRITATILKIDDCDNYSPQIKTDEEVPLDVDYAILNIYRFSGAGTFVNYDLYLGNTVICRVQNSFKTTLHIKKSGYNTLWAKTEAKSEIPIDIEMGKTYYLRCSITMGLFVGRPSLELIDSKEGKQQFESFNAKH